MKILRGFFEQMRGLAFTTPTTEPVIFELRKPQAVCINTFFMRYPVDVTVYGTDGEIIERIEKMKPWRVKFIFMPVYFIIERWSGHENNGENKKKYRVEDRHKN